MWKDLSLPEVVFLYCWFWLSSCSWSWSLARCRPLLLLVLVWLVLGPHLGLFRTTLVFYLHLSYYRSLSWHTEYLDAGGKGGGGVALFHHFDSFLCLFSFSLLSSPFAPPHGSLFLFGSPPPWRLRMALSFSLCLLRLGSPNFNPNPNYPYPNPMGLWSWLGIGYWVLDHDLGSLVLGPKGFVLGYLVLGLWLRVLCLGSWSWVFGLGFLVLVVWSWVFGLGT